MPIGSKGGVRGGPALSPEEPSHTSTSRVELFAANEACEKSEPLQQAQCPLEISQEADLGNPACEKGESTTAASKACEQGESLLALHSPEPCEAVFVQPALGFASRTSSVPEVLPVGHLPRPPEATTQACDQPDQLGLGSTFSRFEAFAQLRFLKERGLQPNVRTYCALVLALVGDSRMDVALDLFVQMKLTGLQPNDTTYEALISACRMDPFLSDKAFELSEEMQQASLSLATSLS